MALPQLDLGVGLVGKLRLPAQNFPVRRHGDQGHGGGIHADARHGGPVFLRGHFPQEDVKKVLVILGAAQVPGQNAVGIGAGIASQHPAILGAQEQGPGGLGAVVDADDGFHPMSPSLASR